MGRGLLRWRSVKVLSVLFSDDPHRRRRGLIAHVCVLWGSWDGWKHLFYDFFPSSFFFWFCLQPFQKVLAIFCRKIRPEGPSQNLSLCSNSEIYPYLNHPTKCNILFNHLCFILWLSDKRCAVIHSWSAQRQMQFFFGFQREFLLFPPEITCKFFAFFNSPPQADYANSYWKHHLIFHNHFNRNRFQTNRPINPLRLELV